MIKNQKFERILVVMFENQYRSYVTGDPFMEKLSRAGADLRNFSGCFHLSQTNYIASLAGEVCGETTDEAPAKPYVQRNLVDILEDRGVSWKAYMEGYPGEKWNEDWANSAYTSNPPMSQYPDYKQGLGRYYRKHNAFASFQSIQGQQQRWLKIVSDQQFWEDVQAGEKDKKLSGLPQYGWFTPDIWNDGHYLYNTHLDTNPRSLLIPQISNWLQHVFFANNKGSKIQTTYKSSTIGLNLDIDLLIENPEEAWRQSNVPEGTLIVVTFDEADFDADDFDTNYDGPNQIYTVLLGSMIKPGTVVETPLNHYSLIKTVQKNFNLDSLNKNDKDANWCRFLWGEEFKWDQPSSSSLTTATRLESTFLDDSLVLLTDDQNGHLAVNFHTDQGLETIPANISVSENAPVSITNLDNEIHLVYADENRCLLHAAVSNSGVSEPQSLGVFTLARPGSIAVSQFLDWADNTKKLMLCYITDKGFINYMVYEDGVWGGSQETGQLTDSKTGWLALTQFGTSLYLVYRERNGFGMRMTSYNVAPFNSFKARTWDNKHEAPENDTSLHRWSPFDMPIGHMALKQAALQNNYSSLGRGALASIEGEMRLIHTGAFADMSFLHIERFGLTGIYTAADSRTNGWGTIKQAGWGGEQPMKHIVLKEDTPLSISSNGKDYFVCWQTVDEVANTTGINESHAERRVMLMRGRYRKQ